jgi:hypothetical protein
MQKHSTDDIQHEPDTSHNEYEHRALYTYSVDPDSKEEYAVEEASENLGTLPPER